MRSYLSESINAIIPPISARIPISELIDKTPTTIAIIAPVLTVLGFFIFSDAFQSNNPIAKIIREISKIINIKLKGSPWYRDNPMINIIPNNRIIPAVMRFMIAAIFVNRAPVLLFIIV